jgi:transcriptional regulator with XRE-family HTH domain
MTKNTFGEYLREKRVEAGLSLRHVAERIGVTHVYLGEIERGKSAPLARKHWGLLMETISGITPDDLETRAAMSKPIKMDLDGAPALYRQLGVRFSQNFESRTLTDAQIQAIMDVLDKVNEAK